MAEQLRHSNKALSFGDWLAAQSAAPADHDVDRIEVRLEELRALGWIRASEPLLKRLDEAREAQSPRRGLLLDGLEVETGRVLAEARRATDLMSALRVLLAEMAQAGLPIAAFAVSEGAVVADEIQERLGAAGAVLARHRADEAAAARRAAVMRGLAGLGYEVREGMTTTFAASGRLVVADAARPGYGIEVSGAADGRQFQMRPVAFTAPGAPADTARDRDAETIWCGQVSELSKSLTASGSGMEIVRALPIGATPLKRVSSPGHGAVEEAETLVTMARSLTKP